jgi:hypothetical protein
MILRLSLNEMVLQSSEHELSFCQRQPDGPGRIVVDRRAASNLVNADGPSALVASITTRHFIPPPVSVAARKRA